MNPVAIIGGGISGLTAGFYLKRAGVPVVLLESSSRVGGGDPINPTGRVLG